MTLTDGLNSKNAICLIADEAVVKLAANAAISVLTNSHKLPICFIGTSVAVCNQFTQLLSKYNAVIDARVVSEEEKTFLLKNIWVNPRRKDLTLGTYLRLYIPKYFCNYDHVLYLDTDVICIKPIIELFNTLQSTNYILAASRQNPKYHPNTITHFFNAGVMAFNVQNVLKTYQEDFAQCITLMKENIKTQGAISLSADQGIINCVYENRIFEISNKYNTQDLAWRKDVIDAEVQKASILHFCGRHKPWLKDGRNKKYWKWYI